MKVTKARHTFFSFDSPPLKAAASSFSNSLTEMLAFSLLTLTFFGFLSSSSSSPRPDVPALLPPAGLSITAAVVERRHGRLEYLSSVVSVSLMDLRIGLARAIMAGMSGRVVSSGDGVSSCRASAASML